jgi:NADH-quinone oxidoreductase subunit E
LDDFNAVLTMLEKENRGSGSLIMILQRLQEAYGYLPAEVLDMLARRMNIPIAQIVGTATFYSQFRFEPIGRYLIRVCHGTACHIAGADKITDTICRNLDIREHETTSDRLFTLERVACIGCCSLAPAITVNEEVYGSLTPDKVVKIIAEYKKRT